MSQKIDSLSPEPGGPRGPSAVQAPATAAPRSRDEAAAVAPTDSIELTRTAQSLQRLEQELRSGQAFDSARVAELRAAIAAGTYRIDPGAVASGLIGLERLLGAQ